MTLKGPEYAVSIGKSGLEVRSEGVAVTLDSVLSNTIVGPWHEQSGQRLQGRWDRGIFSASQTVSLVRVGGVPAVYVDTRVEARESGPIRGLVDHWHVNFRNDVEYRWAPNLRPKSNQRIGSHCFRSPVVCASAGDQWAALIPELVGPKLRASAEKCSLNFEELSGASVRFGYGIEPTRPTGHVYFEVDDAAQAIAGDTFEFGYYLILGSAKDREGILRTVNQILWAHYARTREHEFAPQTVPFDTFAGYAYPSLVNTESFASFDTDGTQCGGIRAEAGHAEYFRRPHPVIWNQVWFNNQRSAYGLAAYGITQQQDDWLTASKKMTQTTLASPVWGGLWPALYAFESGDWFGSIPRLNGGQNRIHLPDVAMTAEWLLKWQCDIEETSTGIVRIQQAVRSICQLQERDGSIPSWVDWDGSKLSPDQTLARSAETAASAAFLGEVALRLKSREAKRAILNAADFVAREITPHQDYQDFETFYSCSPKDLDMVDTVTGIRPQNSLAVYWVARTMLLAFRLTADRDFLARAVEATDSLSLYQQVWDPPFLSLNAFGGFGVMNTDAEWNDARQSLFAPHYFEMYEASGLSEYLERGQAALRASFVLASIPENAVVSPLTYESFKPGLMPENYGHSGHDGPSGRSDACWGEAGALTSVAWIRRHHPDLFVDIDPGRLTV